MPPAASMIDRPSSVNRRTPSERTIVGGSGACAAVVAGVRRHATGRKVAVELDGGSLAIEWLENGHVLMTGPVATAFTGEFDASLLEAAGP